MNELIIVVFSNLLILLLLLRHQAKHTVIGKPVELMKQEFNIQLKQLEVEAIKLRIKELELEAKKPKPRYLTEQDKLELSLEPHE